MAKRETQATPGPWRVGATRPTQIYSADGAPIADVWTPGAPNVRGQGTEAEHDIETAAFADETARSIADARLIAAAPQMREALEAILGDKPDRWGYYAAHNVMDDATREKARAALRAANGED